MWTLLKIIAIAALCYGAIVVWMFLSQRKMLFFPRDEHAATPAEIGLDHEDIWLTNKLGTRIHGWWLPHENPRFTVLFAHGNGGNISHRLETFRILHTLGLSTFIYDYTGYGLSDGEPSEQGMEADALAAWEWLVKEKGIPPEEIVLFGRSLGGAVTARLAADISTNGNSPAGIILESTFTSVPDMGAYIYPWLPVRQLARYSYDSVDALSSVNLPALFAHSQDDEIVPYSIGLRLYESYQGPKTFFELSNDHNSGYLAMEQEYPDGLNQFLRKLEARQ